jgi:hypothetical protein
VGGVQVLERVKGSLSTQQKLEESSQVLRRAIEGRRYVLVTSTGMFRGLGRYLAQLVNSLTSSNAYYVEPYELTYYIAPYDENREVDVLVTATPDGFPDLYILLDQLVLTGHRVTVLSGTLPEQLKSRFSYVDAVEVPWDELGLLRLVQLLAYSVASLGRRDLQRRVRRVLDECTSLHTVVEELVERYKEELDALRSTLVRPHVVTYTPTMEVAAQLLVYGSDRSLAVLADPPSVHTYLRRVSRDVVAFTTDVEVYSLRYHLGRVAELGGRVVELRLRTDPLTAPLYALILVYYVILGGTQ